MLGCLRLGTAIYAGAMVCAPLTAQRPATAVDVSAGGTGSAQRVSAAVWRPVVRPSAGLRVGLGLRVTAYAGDAAAYTNRGTGQGAFGASLGIDPAVYALNAALFGELRLAPRLHVGANLDVLGVGSGPARTVGTFAAEPQVVATFRYGAADRGALNSEFYAALRIGRRLWLRAGASHYVTNYTVTDTGSATAASSRFQRFETVPFVALTLGS